MIPHHRNTSFGQIIEEIGGVVYKEEWRPIEGYETIYATSSFGRIKKLSRKYKSQAGYQKEKLVLPQKTTKGYLRISLRKSGVWKWKYVHRLVAIAFIEKIDGKPCVNHKTGDKLKNHYSQLEWCTDKENNRHAWAMGIYEGVHGKTSIEQRWFIKDNFFTIGREKLAEMFGLTDKYIMRVAKVKVKGTSQRKKSKGSPKKVIDTKTGQIMTTADLCKIWGMRRKYVARILSEERQPNTTQYRYA